MLSRPRLVSALCVLSLLLSAFGQGPASAAAQVLFAPQASAAVPLPVVAAPLPAAPALAAPLPSLAAPGALSEPELAPGRLAQLFDGGSSGPQSAVQAGPEGPGTRAPAPAPQRVRVPVAYDAGPSGPRAGPQSSILAAAALTAFVGWRYLTEHSGSAFLGDLGANYLNDFLTPLGFVAAGYLFSLLGGGRATRSTLDSLPMLGTLLGMLSELSQTAAFKAVFGFGLPGAFDPLDLLAFAVGGLAAGLAAAGLWRPRTERTGSSLGAGLASGGFFIGFRLMAEADRDLALLGMLSAVAFGTLLLLTAVSRIRPYRRR